MNRALEILAKGITGLFYPMFLPTYGMFWLMNTSMFSYQNLDFKVHVVVIGTTFFLTCFIPLSLVLFMLSKGQITDMNITDANERTRPYIYTFIGFLAWAYFLIFVCKVPTLIGTLSLVAATCIFIVAIINHFWKISAHLTGVGCFLGSVLVVVCKAGHLELWFTGVLLLLALIVMWARLYLNAHTPLQVVAGFLLGFLTSTITGWWQL